MQRLTVLLALLLATAPAVSGQTPEPHSDGWRGWTDGLAAARAADRPVLVYVASAGCGPCVRMERDVFPTAAPLLDRLVRVRLDYGDHDAPPSGDAPAPFDVARGLGVAGVPAFVVLAPDGRPVARTAGYLPPDAFALLAAYAATGAYRHVDFPTYARETTSSVPR